MNSSINFLIDNDDVFPKFGSNDLSRNSRRTIVVMVRVERHKKYLRKRREEGAGNGGEGGLPG